MKSWASIARDSALSYHFARPEEGVIDLGTRKHGPSAVALCYNFTQCTVFSPYAMAPPDALRGVTEMANEIAEAHSESLMHALRPDRLCGTIAGAVRFCEFHTIPQPRMVFHLLKDSQGLGIGDLYGCVGFVPLTATARRGHAKFPVSTQQTKHRFSVHIGQAPCGYTAEQMFFLVWALTTFRPVLVEQRSRSFHVDFAELGHAIAATELTHCAIAGDVGAFVGTVSFRDSLLRRCDDIDRNVVYACGTTERPDLPLGPLDIALSKETVNKITTEHWADQATLTAVRVAMQRTERLKAEYNTEARLRRAAVPPSV